MLVVASLSAIVPFAWMVLTSLKPESEVTALSPFPEPPALGELPGGLPGRPRFFGRYYLNSLFVAAWVTFLTCVTSALAAFAFARPEVAGGATRSSRCTSRR